MGNLSMSFASTSVDFFRENVLRHSGEAMQCRDAEDIIQLAIQAFTWIDRAQASLLEIPEDQRAREWEDKGRRVMILYGTWLNVCRFVHDLIKEQHSRNYTPDNEEFFLKCEENAREAVSNQTLISGDGLSLNDTEAAMEATAEAEGVDLDSMLKKASAHFSAPFVIPASGSLSEKETGGLIDDDKRAFGS